MNFNNISNNKMLNKRKNVMDSTRINNYNLFLSTLDKNNRLPNYNCQNTNIDEKEGSDKLEPDKIQLDKIQLDKIQLDKIQLDKIIDNITANYKINNIRSPNFTGQTIHDLLAINDPNEYKDILTDINYVNNKKCLHKYKSTIQDKLESNSKIKENIHIDEEINSIEDILKLIEKYKIDPNINYNINMKALHIIKEPLEELNNMIGMNGLKNNVVDQILYFVQELHKNKNSSGDFMHTVIYGPPGTGKTEIAKIIGKIYSKIGILEKGTFKKVTRSDLIAGYLGQTALKTRDVIKEALGGVLFIDEAYALGNPDKRDSFSKECIDTLCEALSDNKDNLMVIVAGYETELKESFFNYNQGLDSRFTWRFKTDNYTADNLYKIFIKKVKDIGWELHEDSQITVDFFKKNHDYFQFFGRDIETILAKTKIAHSKRVFCKLESEKKKITIKDLEKGFETYLKNDDIKNRKDKEYIKKELYYSIYS